MWLWWIFIQICPSTPFSLCMHDDIFGTMPSRAERRTNQPINQPKRVKFADPYIHNIHQNLCVCLKKWHFNEYDEKLKRFSMLWCLYFSGDHYKAKHTIAVREHMRSWNISCTDILFTQPARPQNRRSKSRIRWKLGLFNTMKTAQPMCAS